MVPHQLRRLGGLSSLREKLPRRRGRLFAGSRALLQSGVRLTRGFGRIGMLPDRALRLRLDRKSVV